jgi:hypothetical protein
MRFGAKRIEKFAVVGGGCAFSIKKMKSIH